MDTPLKIYLASPLGFSEAGRDFMYGRIIPAIESLGHEVLDPWKLTPDALTEQVRAMPYGEEKRQAYARLNKVVGKSNAAAIEAAAAIVAVLDGVDVDSGTAAEIGYAAALGKPIVGYRGDFRLSADNEGSAVNLQVQFFIERNGGRIITEISQLKGALVQVLQG